MSEKQGKEKTKLEGKDRTGGSRFHTRQSLETIRSQMQQVDGSLGEIRGVLKDSFERLSDTIDELVGESLDKELPARLAVTIDGRKMQMPEVVMSHETRLKWLEARVEKRGRPPRA